ncbi:tRNA adenosine(34) deaminase TadA [Aliidiomarina celeris]|uniref:tRNA adenosine(34) deaminase TadA n=1 Tax=Aliidiomarina celeris TaxID=2249428 RepID=UPI000DE8F0CF|nr:tRNA adenosine(34) deaminase TadA [Aliidiomarina celeris]
MNDTAETDLVFMREAIAEAELAAAEGEVPVGAVAVYKNEIVGRGRNQVITLLDPSAHAEMLAIRAAAKTIGNYRLNEVTLYVTLEPCPMCAGLLVHSRISRLVFATPDLKTGAAGSVFSLLQAPQLNHQVAVTQGVCQSQCATMLSEFFRVRRAAKKRLRSLPSERIQDQGK